jgi:nitroreductase
MSLSPVMSLSPRDHLLSQLNWRYATKQFDPKRKISPEDWAALEQALVLTPSSFGLQPWKFVVVSDPALREKLVAASWNQRQVAEASHLVVLTIKSSLTESDIEEFIQLTARVRGVAPASLSGYRDMMIGSIVKGMDGAARAAWATRQVYIALGNLLTSAAVLGLDACPMEGINPAQYDSILGLEKEGLHTVVACPVGYRATTDKYAALVKVRFPKEAVLVEV